MGEPKTSRLSGFYRLPAEERRSLASQTAGIPVHELRAALVDGGLDDAMADKTIENVIGRFALPFALGLNLRINGKDVLAPMVIEEPSVVAAAGNAACWARAGDGFLAEADPSIMIGQIQLIDVANFESAQAAIDANQTELLEIARAATPGLCQRGGGPQRLRTRDLGTGMIVVELEMDVVDAMGANAVNTASEALAPRLAELTQSTRGIAIVSNLCDQRRVRVRCRIPFDALRTEGFSGKTAATRIQAASDFADRCAHRATTHNKGIMNGVDAVVIATGNDFRAVEAGAHAYAARSGRYRPLCTWKIVDAALQGELEMPLAIGVVGGIARVHRGAAMAKKLAGTESASELAMVAASVGMASNLAALHALATVGIQRGHMGLHARSLALAAGASGDEVDRVAAQMRDEGKVSLEDARRHLHP